jgi:adenosylcobinamide-phosphate synthase
MNTLLMSRPLIILTALLLDLTLGDPPNRFHPVVLMGRWLIWGRRLAPASHRFGFGAGWVLAGLAFFSLPWLLLKPPAKSTTLAGRLCYLVEAAALLKAVFAYRSLRQAVLEVAAALEANDLPAARRRLSWHLVSRDTDDLSAEEVAGAAIESLAENLTDGLTAPLLAYAAGGLPAAWAYRFVNTADAMWGYRTPEFEQLGKFPARLDDLLNWLPARLTGWLLVAAAGLAGEDAPGAARVMLAQQGRTASPNAGWTMAAAAGALGVTLTKRGVYRLEGGPNQPDVAAMRRALRLADLCVGLGVICLVSILFFPHK